MGFWHKKARPSEKKGGLSLTLDKGGSLNHASDGAGAEDGVGGGRIQ